MPSGDVVSLGVREMAEAIRARTASPVELVEACLTRIRKLDGELRAWAHIDAEGALAIAREREVEARASRLCGPLHGVPVGVKDIFDVAGMPTTGGAKAFAHTRPTADACTPRTSAFQSPGCCCRRQPEPRMVVRAQLISRPCKSPLSRPSS